MGGGMRQLPKIFLAHDLDTKKPWAALKNPRPRHFVRGVQNCRSASAALQGAAGKPKRWKSYRIGRLESERAGAYQVQPRRRRFDPLRPAKREGDWGTHVGRTELRQHRAVD